MGNKLPNAKPSGSSRQMDSHDTSIVKTITSQSNAGQWKMKEPIPKRMAMPNLQQRRKSPIINTMQHDVG